MSLSEINQENQIESPVKIIETVMNYRASKVLLVATSYDLFTQIHNGTNTLSRLSKKIKVNARALQLLLEALVSLGYLTVKEGLYLNTNQSALYLVAGEPGYLGNNLKYQEIIWDAWSDLKGVLKRGKPKSVLNQWLKRNDFSKDYIQGMANIARRPAREIVSKLPGFSPTHILDVGAGPGIYSLAFLEAFATTKATLLDLPSTIAIAKSLLKGNAHSNRIFYKPGNYHTSSFGVACYDLVMMSHITHDEGEKENQKLIQKAFRALKPGGKLIVHDFMSDDSVSLSPFLGLFSIHMLVYTKSGKVYSVQNYESWMSRAGFSDLDRHDISKELPNTTKILIGTR